LKGEIMPRSDRAFVDFKVIKQSVSMVQILEYYGLMRLMRQTGDTISGCCPIHNGQNETAFRVSISKNCWNCFSDCKSGGNVLDFVSRKECVDVHSAALLLADWFNVAVVQPQGCPGARSRIPGNPKRDGKPNNSRIVENVTTIENPPLRFTLNHLEVGHPYLRQRGLTDETISTFGLGFCKKGILAGHVAIPIHNAKGELVAYAGRWPGPPPNPDDKYRFPKGFKKSLEVFNLHRAAQIPADRPLVIVEGFFDCMNLWQSGVERVVSLMGSTLCDHQEAQILRLISREHKIIFLFDEDDAGRTCRAHALQRFATKAYGRVVELPREGLQPDQLTVEEINGLALRDSAPNYGKAQAVVRLGRLLSTPNALERIPNEEILAAIARHQSGDWGDLDEHDRAANERALRDGSRLFSVYHSLAGVKFYIITEADRSVTTVLLPEDY
jgi:DNA primase